MRKIRPAPLASIVVALFLLTSSLVCLVIQPDPIPLVSFWMGGLFLDLVLISASALTLRQDASPGGRALWTRGRVLPMAAAKN